MPASDPRERTLLGQFYTPRRVADLLVALTLDRNVSAILDPACGDGELLLAARDHLAARGHSRSSLAGIDIDPHATALAATRLAHSNPPANITTGDFFTTAATPTWDIILANPPYVRSQQQDDRDPQARARLFAAASAAGVDADPKTDLFAFFLYHSLSVLKIGGRLGFIVPATWLTSRYAVTLQRVLTGPLRLRMLIASSVESFIPDVDMHTVLLIADRTPDAPQTPIKFVTLRQPLANFDPAATILNCQHSREDDRLRIDITLPPDNWSLRLRAPLSATTLFADPAFTPLASLARVALGYKSLQNDFYYLDTPTTQTHAIEPQYLSPIHMLGDLDATTYIQSSPPARHIFLCRDPPPIDTGAARYIAAMADRPAARRKQSSTAQTIREALTAQGGAHWYAPKARPHAAPIWLRKAIDGVHAPLLFTVPAVVDQRCNSLTPHADLPWELLAAVLTSSLFAYSVEVHGAASLGAGALEATTTRLRDYPVVDPRTFTGPEQSHLLALAHAVWSHESPIDWRHATPGPHLRALDAWLLARTAVDLSPDRLHADLRATCGARIAAARPR